MFSTAYLDKNTVAPSSGHHAPKNEEGPPKQALPYAIWDRSYAVMRSVLDDLRDGAHGALLDAVPACDACVLVHVLRYPIDDLEDVLRASVYADAATDALVSFNDWM